jgi:hypothetical protein
MSVEPTLEGIITGDAEHPPIMIRTRGKTIVPRSPTQIEYMHALARNDVIFALGPAGTGKTYIAVAQAVSQLINGSVKRLILSRPAVEAGEKLGFLPGDMKDKVDPYLRPLYDALYDCMPPEQVERRLASGEIEVAPIAFMRGRTLADAFVILDEAQNTTAAQMKMFLTRFGMNSRMVICGDPKQVDLPGGMAASGLGDAVSGWKASKASPRCASIAAMWCATRSWVASWKPMKARTRAENKGLRSGGIDIPPSASRGTTMLTLEIDIEAPWPASTDWEALAARAAGALTVVAPEVGKDCLAASVLFTSDEEVQALNAQWRDKDKPTNVLSFPCWRARICWSWTPTARPNCWAILRWRWKPARARRRKRASRWPTTPPTSSSTACCIWPGWITKFPKKTPAKWSCWRSRRLR